MRIFYDVDTQNDFMNKDGALYVPEAESIRENIRLLTEHARTKKIKIAGSVDAHSENDPEFEIFPPHCVKGTEGQKKIIPSMPGEIYFKKQHYDIFTNPEFSAFLKQIKVIEAIVYGVATDYCVKAAVLGMQMRNVQCYVVEDAIKGVDPKTTKGALEDMAKNGAEFIKTKDILEGKI